MSASNDRATWLELLHALAKRNAIALPPPVSRGMGVIEWQSENSSRKVTLRRSLLPAPNHSQRTVLWGFWSSEADVQPVALVRESDVPDETTASYYVSLIHQWLVDFVSGPVLQEAVSNKEAITNHLGRLGVGIQEIWIGPNDEFGIIRGDNQWRAFTGSRNLFIHRDGAGVLSSSLPISSFHEFGNWLRANWPAIAFGVDLRPPIIRDGGVSACRAVDAARACLPEDSSAKAELDDWWARHAIRTADPHLPNLYLERQSDDFVVSWNSIPSGQISYHIGHGTQVIPAKFAIPALWEIARTGTPSESTTGNKGFAEPVAELGLHVLQQYHSTEPLSSHWLANIGFADRELSEFVSTGISRHPVVGLLRSSRSSQITLADVEHILSRLKKAAPSTFTHLRELARGMDASIDPREPWMSGYVLAAEVRQRLNVPVEQYVDVERLTRDLGIDILEIEFADNTIRGACVGAPQFQPTIVVNPSCAAASGFSGRRTTLAHELCHLLFDRSRMRGLARFEGPVGDADRLTEMRANAFAVELLVPMKVLIDNAGQVLADHMLGETAECRGVSTHALIRHAENLRKYLRESLGEAG